MREINKVMMIINTVLPSGNKYSEDDDNDII